MNDLRKWLLAALADDIFSDTVKNHDRVGHRIPQDGQRRRHKHSSDFDAVVVRKKRHDTNRNDKIVEERDDSRDAKRPWGEYAPHGTKHNRQINGYRDQEQDHSCDAFRFELLTDSRTDIIEPLFSDCSKTIGKYFFRGLTLSIGHLR